jgi:hypothetical protein
MNYRSIAILFVALASSPFLLHAEERDERPTSAVVTAGPVSVMSSIDKATASVAEPIQLKLIVQAPPGSRIAWPPLDKTLGMLELTHLTKSNDVPSDSNPNLREWVLQLTLESIKTGDLAIPPIDIRYATDSNAEFQAIQSSPLRVHISSVLEERPDPKRFRDIKQTVDVQVTPASSKSWVLWASGSATAVALLLMATAVRRRNRGLAPAAWALASIADLEGKGAAEADATCRFNEVVEIVREYLEIEFGVDALSRTTNEFLSGAVYEIDLPPKTTERLKWLASVADEIKFARLDIGTQHFEQAIVQAKALVAECDQHRRTIEKGAA